MTDQKDNKSIRTSSRIEENHNLVNPIKLPPPEKPSSVSDKVIKMKSYLKESFQPYNAKSIMTVNKKKAIKTIPISIAKISKPKSENEKIIEEREGSITEAKENLKEAIVAKIKIVSEGKAAVLQKKIRILNEGSTVAVKTNERLSCSSTANDQINDTGATPIKAMHCYRPHQARISLKSLAEPM